VLLYNFFSSSPLQNKWRVVYDYMKNKNVIASSEQISHPDFDRNKHYLLCSELKQLYVAITRTRQRLWICESTDDYCQTMFDYWKKLCIVEVRLLDSKLIQAMQKGSSADDWRIRGTKVSDIYLFLLNTMIRSSLVYSKKNLFDVKGLNLTRFKCGLYFLSCLFLVCCRTYF
jgi:hypothetical protein